MRFARIIDNQLRSGRGSVNGTPRISNVTRASYFLGYTEANTEATTAFSRVKTARAVFSGSADAQEGDLLQDLDDSKYYLVMGLKRERNADEVAYMDATLLWAHAVCDIQRFEPGTLNAFGREVDPAPTTKYTGVRVTTSSVAINVNEQEDRSLPQDKIKVFLQSSYAVQENDRLVTVDNGVTTLYRVVSIAPSELRGLTLLYVDKDQR